MMDLETAWILADPACRSHIVYPYTEEWRLVNAVGFYTNSGIAREGAVILIVTEAHRYAIKRYLKIDGNIERLEASGQLSFLDPAELMSAFMVDGMPDPKLFKAGIKTLIERASRDERTGRSRDVRLFGEMVSLLWPANRAAAERLEELGNEIVAEYSIPILCAYSVGGPGREPLPESLIKAHSHAIAW
jgi:DcmR-like sensory protein